MPLCIRLLTLIEVFGEPSLFCLVVSAEVTVKGVIGLSCGWYGFNCLAAVLICLLASMIVLSDMSNFSSFVSFAAIGESICSSMEASFLGRGH